MYQGRGTALFSVEDPGFDNEEPVCIGGERTAQEMGVAPTPPDDGGQVRRALRQESTEVVMVVDLATSAHPSRTARKEVRRFLASLATALVRDAGLATTEITRVAARHREQRLVLRATYRQDTATVKVEVETDDPAFAAVPLPTVAALAAGWGSRPTQDGAVVWFELRSGAAASCS